MYCATQDEYGTYTLTPSNSDMACDGLMLTTAENSLAYWVRVFVDPTIYSVEQYQELWVYGFSTPMILYLTAFMMGQLIGMFNVKND